MPQSKIEQVCQKLQAHVQQQLNSAQKVEVGIIDDAEVATYASYVEFGWVQRVTAKQAGWFIGQGVDHPPKVGSALVNPARPFLRATAAACGKKRRPQIVKKFFDSSQLFSTLAHLIV